MRDAADRIETSDLIGLRDRALILFSYYSCWKMTQIRHARVAQLRRLARGPRRGWAVIDPRACINPGACFVPEDWTVVALNPLCTSALLSLMAVRSDRDRPEAMLFPAMSGRAWRPTEQPMTKLSAARIVTQRFRHVLSGVRLTPRDLRLAGFKQMLDIGVSANEARRTSGYRSTAALQIISNRLGGRWTEDEPDRRGLVISSFSANGTYHGPWRL
ncbi:hypothetical protein [Paracoccus denitrificans]|uniref:hypothetical protein n=1 Tax=Paracoccus denitrificans TaxID=266 RepID=UPI00131A3EFD|nr:hypothetical protein [Paracoccus denitrificans]